MDVLWAAPGPMGVRDVLDQLNADRRQQLAYTTVMTVMSRLADKDILQRTKHGRGFVYEPLVTDTAGIAVRDVIRDYGESAVAHFVEEAQSDPKLLRRLERLMQRGR
jgi:predicted transcriptional regulator